MNKTRTINFLVTTAFPNAFFLDDALWRVNADPAHLNSLTNVGDVVNERRVKQSVFDAVETSWRQHNTALARNDPFPIVVEAEFELINYNHARISPGYDTFVCPRCERIYTRQEISRSNFRCPEHQEVTVSQLAHIFVHTDCGSIAQITPKYCWNRFDGQRCSEKLRLHFEYQQMGSSYWWCPRCRYERRLPESREGDQQGWNLGQVQNYCNTCSVDGQPPIRMSLTPARTLLKPQRVDLIDMPDANSLVLLQEWFGQPIDDAAILSELPPQLRRQYETNPQSQQMIRQMFQMDTIGDAGIPELEPYVQEELSNFSGACQAIIQREDNLADNVRTFINERFGLHVSLLDNLAIVRATYGYLVGNSSPEVAILRVFPMGGPRYAVLTQRSPTEALLFELIPNKVLSWLHEQQLGENLENESDLRRHLVTCDPGDEILNVATGLIHSASHALRRSSERYTGMGRDVVDELLFPRGLAWVLYNNWGSELGMFTTTFEGRMREWLMGTQYDVTNCPLDPICMREEVAACPGCLQIGERGCTTLWNRYLDRRYLVSLPSSTRQGYWSL